MTKINGLLVVLCLSLPLKIIEARADVLSSHEELSADKLHVPSSLIRHSWAQKKAPPHSLFDWNILAEFNLRAAQSWEMILKCTTDAEEARRSYLENSFDCAQKKQITAGLRELHQALRSFIQSSTIQTKDQQSAVLRAPHSPNMPLGEIVVSKMADAALFNQAPHILPTLHPLFVQMVLELWVSDYHFFMIDEVSEEFITIVIDRLLEKAPNKKLDPEILGHAQRLVNLLKLMDLFPMGDCSMWGLWPYSLAIILRSTANCDYSTDEKAYRISDITAKYFAACGNPEEIHPVQSIYRQHHSRLSGPHENLDEDAVEERVDALRELQEQYFD